MLKTKTTARSISKAYVLAAVCSIGLVGFSQVANAATPAGDAWLMYRVMGLDDLRLALGQLELRLEGMKTEAARTRKLAAAGAAPQAEVMESEGGLAMASAERDELSALIDWHAYLLDLSKNSRAFVEEEYFKLLLATLEPRMRHAQAVVDLMEKRHQMNTRLAQRKAIPSQDFESSADQLAEARARGLFYKTQAVQARHALEIRQGRREYQAEESDALARAVLDARKNLWETVVRSIDHRLARLQALRAKGVIAQAELDSAEESRRAMQKALDDARQARPEAYPEPGKLKRPPSQFT